MNVAVTFMKPGWAAKAFAAVAATALLAGMFAVPAVAAVHRPADRPHVPEPRAVRGGRAPSVPARAQAAVAAATAARRAGETRLVASGPAHRPAPSPPPPAGRGTPHRRGCLADWDLEFCGQFGAPIDSRDDWEDWRELIRAAGIRDTRVHDARHTAATLLLDQGVSVRVVRQRHDHRVGRVGLEPRTGG